MDGHGARRHGGDQLCLGTGEDLHIAAHSHSDGGTKPVDATQWIGWDPINRRIHSFVYDSRGGYSQGVWTNEGDAWAVTSVGVSPDGKKSTATNLYTKVDDNSAIWESINDELDSSQGADIRLRVTRKPAAD